MRWVRRAQTLRPGTSSMLSSVKFADPNNVRGREVEERSRAIHSVDELNEARVRNGSEIRGC